MAWRLGKKSGDFMHGKIKYIRDFMHENLRHGCFVYILINTWVISYLPVNCIKWKQNNCMNSRESWNKSFNKFLRELIDLVKQIVGNLTGELNWLINHDLFAWDQDKTSTKHEIKR